MMTFLVYLAIILGVIAVAQIVRVFEIASQLRGGRGNDVTERDNRANATMMMVFLIAFFAFCFWNLMEYKDLLLPISASEHGEDLDWLFNFNMIILAFVFIVTHILLFYFAFKYYGRAGRRAVYYPHNNKLELLWTSVPAVVLAVIIFFGLKMWNQITAPLTVEEQKKVRIIELYSKQFDWTARYAGKDNVLGFANYKLVQGANMLGLDSTDKASMDDIIVKGELHIPKGEEVMFKFRSQDVIHSAFFPHFRAQMNTVPGMSTEFHFKPTITTEEMRKITGNPKFEYWLLCNKICGASHYNMKMSVIVDEPADYKKWLAEQATFIASPNAAANTEGPAMPQRSESTGPNEVKRDQGMKDNQSDGNQDKSDKSDKGN